MAATVAGPVRVDLYVEPIDEVGAVPRLRPPQVFHGHPPAFTVAETPTEPAAQLARLVRGYFFGFPTPARLAGRGSYGTLILNAVQVVFQFVVPAMLAQSNPHQMFRETMHAEQHLPAAQQRRVRELVEAVGTAAAGIGSGEPDWEALRAAHELVVGTLLAELRRACELHDVPWPDDTEQAVREFFAAELGVRL